MSAKHAHVIKFLIIADKLQLPYICWFLLIIGPDHFVNSSRNTHKHNKNIFQTHFSTHCNLFIFMFKA